MPTGSAFSDPADTLLGPLGTAKMGLLKVIRFPSIYVRHSLLCGVVTPHSLIGKCKNHPERELGMCVNKGLNGPKQGAISTDSSNECFLKTCAHTRHQTLAAVVV